MTQPSLRPDSDGRDVDPTLIIRDEEACDPPRDAEQLDAPLTDADLQAYYAAQHRKQLRQRQCPGCGEDELF
jgi:hypothetical protein